MGLEHWKVRFVHDVDLSPEKIAERLRDLGQLYELAISLGKAKVLGSTQTVLPPEKH